METTIQARRQMLRRLCMLGRVGGWAMILMSLMGVGDLTYAHLIAHVGGGVQVILNQGLEIAGNILTGLLVLGTVQFIRYVLEEDTESKWLLRNGHILLSLFALFLFMKGGLRMGPYWWSSVEHILTFSTENMLPMGRPILITFTTVTSFLPLLTKVLCFLGLAAILRTVLPVMAESKTLA